MSFLKMLFKKIEDPQVIVSDGTFGKLTLIDLHFRGKFWETVYRDIKLMIAYDGVNKVPTEEVLSLARTTFKNNWLENSLRSAIDLALEQNPVEYHDKINGFTIYSLSFSEEGKIFIGLCTENLWFADFQAGEIKNVWLDV